MHGHKIDRAACTIAQEPLEVSEAGAGRAGVGDGGGAELEAGIVEEVVGAVGGGGREGGVGEGLYEGLVSGDGARDGHAGGLGGGAEVGLVEGEEGVGAVVRDGVVHVRWPDAG